MLYVLIAIVTSCLTVLAVKFKEKPLKIFLGLTAIVIPSYIASIRYATGTDYFNYLSLFHDRHIKDVEISFIFIRDIVNLLNLDFNVFLFIYSFITNAFVFFIIFRERKNINVFIAMFVYMLFYYTLSYNLIRQSAAMSIILFSYVYYFENKKFKFGLLNLSAFLIHYSSIIICLVLMIFSSVTKFNKKFRYIIYCLLLIFVIKQQYFLSLVNLDFGKYNYAINEFQSNYSLFPLVMYLPVLITAIVANKIPHDIKDRMSKYINIYCIGFILIFLMNFGGNNAYRIAYYFTIVEVILVGLVWKINKNSRLYYINIVLIVYLLWKFWYIFIKLGSTEIYPFKSIM
ncbi:EpsG family protein [Lysinibacillus antri]|uniref:EpsG family protein n=1 Tax=Lysinibacillus antri TaxID=2498145 RepID=A0A3S0RKQ1_9BACI|nr:EpsG family protein [Lysinibacillus antri]RUL55176.1 EpsG family protein [Lysinibacillus antri]